MSLRSKLDRLRGDLTERLASPHSGPAPFPFVPVPLAERAAECAPEIAASDTLTPDGADGSRSATLTDLRARIQSVLERHARKAPAPPPPVDTVDLPFVTQETARGPLSIRVQRLSAAHRTGRAPLLPSRDASMRLLALLALDPSLAECDPSKALYLDTETTGLHGGTGTVAFLVGLAYWQEGSGGLTVEQVLVRNLGEEEPMLAHVRDRIAAASMLVTFNGKSFDMPLLRTRFVMARLEAPTEPPHLDLVHVARRIHKPRGVECRLTSIERSVLGFARVNDVPGGEVSACYLHFLRTGDANALLGVIEHNAWDVVAMAALVGLYGEPLVTNADGTSAPVQLEAEDLVGVARTLKRARAPDEAWVAIEQSIARGGGDASVRARAELAKARGDRARALADFESLARGVGDASVRLELAKLYEHHARDAARALAMVELGTSEAGDASEKRRARLARKVAKRGTQAQGDLPGMEKKRA